MKGWGDDSPAFDLACDSLEALTTMSRGETRGTLRITLREAGLDTKRVSLREIGTVAATTLPRALRIRGISDAPEVCRRFEHWLAGRSSAEGPGEASPV